MNNKPSRLLLCTACAIAALVIAIVSCNKKFDAPPGYIPPNITANTSIAELKSKHVSGQVDSLANLDPTKPDMIIGGVVIANDSSGNFYKQIVLQDSTGGIAVSIDDYNLYASFPIGRKVYVKLKGLFMSENDGLIYVGGSPDAGGTVSGIASRLKDQYLVKGEINVPVTPTTVTIADLRNNPTKYMYTLIQFNSFEVKDSDTSKTWANATPTSKTDANIIVKGCGSNDTMIIRSSGYSNFANVFVPKGNGTLTAVYAFYKSPYNGRITPQVIIRDTSDVQFKDSRCDGTEPPPTSNATLISIKSLRAMYQSGGVILGNYKIGGVVISDQTNKNIASGSFVMQDGDRGVSVYYGGTISYAVGDSVVIDVTGDSLISYRGSLEVKTARGATAPSPVASNKTVTPVDLNISQLNGSLSDIEFTMVKIHSATASGSPATFSGNKTLTDATGNMALYTSSSATFATTALPSGAKDWIGYGSFFNTTKQFQIRSTSDISDATNGDTTGTTPPTDTTTTPPPVTTADLMFSEYVEGSSNNKYIELYNAGTSAINLADYVVRLYANGGTSATNSAKLDTLVGMATLPAGGILVLKNASATLTLPSGVTAYSSNVTNFNGNDALTIEKSGTVIDVFGVVGTDPTGGSWTVAGDAKAAIDHTVRRLTSVLMGNTDWTASSASEWSVNAKDDVSNLGTR